MQGEKRWEMEVVQSAQQSWVLVVLLLSKHIWGPKAWAVPRLVSLVWWPFGGPRSTWFAIQDTARLMVGGRDEFSSK